MPIDCIHPSKHQKCMLWIVWIASLNCGTLIDFVRVWTFPKLICQLEYVFKFERDGVRAYSWMQSPKREHHCFVRGYLCPHFLNLNIESPFAICDLISLVNYYPIRYLICIWIGTCLIYWNCQIWSFVYVDWGIASNNQWCKCCDYQKSSHCSTEFVIFISFVPSTFILNSVILFSTSWFPPMLL